MKMVHGGNSWIMNAMQPWRGVRTDRYTYTEMEGTPWLLFDNREDPFQMTNLIGDPERAGLRARLRSETKGWMEVTGDSGIEGEIDAFRDQQKKKYPRWSGVGRVGQPTWKQEASNSV